MMSPYLSAMIPVVKIGIQRPGKTNKLTVNAAQVNPTLEEVQKWVSCAQCFVVAN